MISLRTSANLALYADAGGGGTIGTDARAGGGAWHTFQASLARSGRPPVHVAYDEPSRGERASLGRFDLVGRAGIGGTRW